MNKMEFDLKSFTKEKEIKTLLENKRGFLDASAEEIETYRRLAHVRNTSLLFTDRIPGLILSLMGVFFVIVSSGIILDATGQPAFLDAIGSFGAVGGALFAFGIILLIGNPKIDKTIERQKRRENRILKKLGGN